MYTDDKKVFLICIHSHHHEETINVWFFLAFILPDPIINQPSGTSFQAQKEIKIISE